MGWQKEVPHLVEMARRRVADLVPVCVAFLLFSRQKTYKRIPRSRRFFAFLGKAWLLVRIPKVSARIGRFGFLCVAHRLPSFSFLLFPPARWLSLPPPRLSCSTAGTLISN
jgi:hypothetical protein